MQTTPATFKPGIAPSHPSPGQLHSLIVQRRSMGRYWTITTMPAPFLPWSPLPAYSEKETRICHCSKSRIHQLQCGHVVAVVKEAESCAANCVGMDMEGIIEKHVATPLDPEIDRMRTSRQEPRDIAELSQAVLLHYHQAFVSGSDPVNGLERAEREFAIFKGMSFVHQKPKSNLVGGDFACTKCKAPGHRASVPAFIYQNRPYFIIIPVHDDDDANLVRALAAGVRPRGPGPSHQGRKNGYNRGRGGRRSGVQSGRITRRRMDEKTTVLSKIREENVLEDIETMSLFSEAF